MYVCILKDDLNKLVKIVS